MHEILETWVWSLGQEDTCRRKWQPTPVFLPEKFHGYWSLVGYSPWGCKKLDMTEQLTLSLSFTSFERSEVSRGKTRWEWGPCSRIDSLYIVIRFVLAGIACTAGNNALKCPSVGYGATQVTLKWEEETVRKTSISLSMQGSEKGWGQIHLPGMFSPLGKSQQIMLLLIRVQRAGRHMLLESMGPFTLKEL